MNRKLPVFLLDLVRRFVREHRLFDADTRVLAAVSGGSDSIALLNLLHALDSAGHVHLVGAAHFNHELRSTSDRDELCAARAAHSLAVPFIADRERVRARAEQMQQSLEVAARTARYAFLERARREFGADVVALGHTRDDQAETVLLRMMRGAGPHGLAGMRPRRDTIVRPLLECRRHELRAFLDARSIPFVDDETNADVTVPRNRVRAELVPLLERFNPSAIDTLAREADLARELSEWLEQESARALAQPAVYVPHPSGLEAQLRVAGLRALPPPVRREVLRQAMTRMAGGRQVSFDHVAAALRLLDLDHGVVDVPGHRVHRSGEMIVLTVRRSGERNKNLFQYSLSIPGEARLVETGVCISAELMASGERPPRAGATGRGPAAWVRADRCRGPLSVRNRRPGDRFRPIGVGGRKKLQDYFVDRKVARAARDRVPLVVDSTGRIVWVAGFGIDEEFQVTDGSQSVLLLRLT